MDLIINLHEYGKESHLIAEYIKWHHVDATSKTQRVGTLRDDKFI